jgi:hypothetical protein
MSKKFALNTPLTGKKLSKTVKFHVKITESQIVEEINQVFRIGISVVRLAAMNLFRTVPAYLRALSFVMLRIIRKFDSVVVVCSLIIGRILKEPLFNFTGKDSIKLYHI